MSNFIVGDVDLDIEDKDIAFYEFAKHFFKIPFHERFFAFWCNKYVGRFGILAKNLCSLLNCNFEDLNTYIMLLCEKNIIQRHNGVDMLQCATIFQEFIMKEQASNKPILKVKEESLKTDYNLYAQFILRFMESNPSTYIKIGHVAPPSFKEADCSEIKHLYLSICSLILKYYRKNVISKEFINAFYKFVWIYTKFEAISKPSKEVKESAIESMLELAEDLQSLMKKTFLQREKELLNFIDKNSTSRKDIIVIENYCDSLQDGELKTLMKRVLKSLHTDDDSRTYKIISSELSTIIEGLSHVEESRFEESLQELCSNALKVLDQATEKKSADSSFVIEGNIKGVNSWLKLKAAEGETASM